MMSFIQRVSFEVFRRLDPFHGSITIIMKKTDESGIRNGNSFWNSFKKRFLFHLERKLPSNDVKSFSCALN